MQSLKRFFYFSLIVFSLFVVGCRSTKIDYEQTQVLDNGLEINAYDNSFEVCDTDFEKSEDDKFIFLRIYLVEYKDKAYPGNTLRGLIKKCDPNIQSANHCAVGFNLNDEDFYGITYADKYHVKKESCTDTSTNGYMKKTNVYTSVQTTLALKVSEEEYNSAKERVEADAANKKIRYSLGKLIPTGIQGLKRKRLSKKDEAKTLVGNVPSTKGYVDVDKPQKTYVCSSWVAHVLAKSVQKIKDFFVEKKINYCDIMPSDLMHLPGTQKLFASSFCDYKIAAGQFVNNEPEFADWLQK